MNEETRKTVLAMTLMSDILFNAFMNENKECMAYILSVIMDRNDLNINRLETQYTIPNPFSRGVRFDVFATDDYGHEYDVEVQQVDSGAIPKRARYNSSMMDYRALDKGQDWEKLPATCVIFITENDVLGGDKPIYHIERCIRELENKSFGDKTQIIYINGAYKVKSGEVKTALINLIEDFHCVNADDMNSALLANRMKQIKSSEKEMGDMCKEVEKYAEKYAEKKASQAKTEGKIEGKIEEIKRLINAGITTLAIIKESGLYTPEELDAISAP